MLLHLADSLVEKGHAHAANIKQWVFTVDERYKDFSVRMDNYREKLEKKLGLTPEVRFTIFTDFDDFQSIFCRTAKS